MKLIVVPKVAICKRLDELGFERAIPLINKPREGEKKIGFWNNLGIDAYSNCFGTTCHVLNADTLIKNHPKNCENKDYILPGSRPGFVGPNAMQRFLSQHCTPFEVEEEDLQYSDTSRAVLTFWLEKLNHTALSLGRVNGEAYFFHQMGTGNVFDIATVGEITRMYRDEKRVLYMPPTAMA